MTSWHNKMRSQAVAVVLLLTLGAVSSPALVDLDFETPYLVQPGQQIWDFCLVENAGQYHAFYHTIPQQDLNPANADTIWHAVSPDLRHWDIVGPVLTSGPAWYDEVAMWAPDVVFDPVSARWAMLYTGVADKMVQRPCLAWSPDLQTWTKSLANPVFEPDSLVYHWGPDQAWSSFRDPFVFNDGTQWNMLSTAALRLGGYPGYRRAIIHRAVSTDLENWQDAGAFYTHDGATGQNYDLESPQYLVRNGWHHLFFTEQDPNVEHAPTSHLVAADPTLWTMTERDIVDAGWAPEIDHFGSPSDTDVFARLAKDQDPRDGTWFVTAKFDSVRFTANGQIPEVFAADPLGEDWPVRLGLAAEAAPTFGDNAVLRNDFPQYPQGHGWFSSLENYGGPLSGVGQPGARQVANATGTLQSRAFNLSTGYLGVMLIGGATGADVHVALDDADTGVELARLQPFAGYPLQERIWDLAAFTGRSVRLRIVDQDTTASGWLAVDRIREVEGPSDVRLGPQLPREAVANLLAYPNPFNGGTVVRFDLKHQGVVGLEVFDLAGRRVWRSSVEHLAEGQHEMAWHGTDNRGRVLPAALYLFRVNLDGVPVARGRFSLVK